MSAMEWSFCGVEETRTRCAWAATLLIAFTAAVNAEEATTNESAPATVAAVADDATPGKTETPAAAKAEAPKDGEPNTEKAAVPPKVTYATHSEAMTAIHNHYRAQSGLRPQAVDANLTAVAQNWANQMAASGSMYHGGGEQIIAYSGGDRSYHAGFNQWLGSSPHRSWLCSSGDRCGFGYAIGRNGCAYYAGAFGSSAAYNPYQTAGYSQSNTTAQVELASHSQPATTATTAAPTASNGNATNYSYSNSSNTRGRRWRRR